MRGNGFWQELQRRNVVRASVLYVGAVWALSQGVSQLSPALGLPDYTTRWFLIACVIGFPLWVAFAWFYEFTPHGFKRDSTLPADAPMRHSNARRLDRGIIGVMAVAIVLLTAGYFVRGKPPAPQAPAIPAKSVAVMPFQNLSSDKDNEYFVSGMQDLILTKLADIGNLKVIARTSTAQYATHPGNLASIRTQLGVATVLEGTVQRAGNEVLINVQLIDTATDNHIWAKAYTRTLDNVFGVEGDVAEKIANALKDKLSPSENERLASDMSSNHAANDLFLRAEYEANQGQVNYATASMKAAIPLYRQAIEQAPDFALAYARLSYTESHLAWFGGGGTNVPQLNADARSNAEQALKLAPHQPAAYLALGYSDYYGRGDYAGALKAFRQALELRPNDADAIAAMGYVQNRQGDFTDAIASFQQASTLDPRNSSLAFDLGLAYMMLAHYPDAEGAFQRALALDPHNINAKTFLANAILYATGDIPKALAAVAGDDPSLQLMRVNLLTLQRRYPDALALLAKIPDTPDNFSPGPGSGPKALQAAGLYRLMGDDARARPLYAKVLPELRDQLAQQQGVNAAFVWQNLASAELGAGDTKAGLAATAKAQAIVDATHDHAYGPELMESNAALYAQAARPDLAVPILARALASPGIGVYYAPALLWLDPVWDPIRHDPAFEALLRKYAADRPKTPPASAVTAAGAA